MKDDTPLPLSLRRKKLTFDFPGDVQSSDCSLQTAVCCFTRRSVSSNEGCFTAKIEPLEAI